MDKERKYLAIDLKSFYASVECVERNLDPLTTNLVVADEKRTEKTICLAVSPSLKSYGIPSRPRLFEVIQKVNQINDERLKSAIKKSKSQYNKNDKYLFTGSSFNHNRLANDHSLKLSFIIAPPRMKLYEEYSDKIHSIYSSYVSPNDIIVYSIDEVFIDITEYIHTYKISAQELAMTMIHDVLCKTGITATAGIGTNLYLAKVCMDIVAKHTQPDKYGVRIAELDEQKYKENLWQHKPITDFWRVGNGIAKKLEKLDIYTMGDIARLSLDHYYIEKIYKVFGKNAELLIDHAWGIESTSIKDIKAYQLENRSISSGQVLQEPYDYMHTRLIVWEMADMLSLDLVDKRLVTNRIVLTIGYDCVSLSDGHYKGDITTDRYGRKIPKHAHGTINLKKYLSSTQEICKATIELFDRIFDKTLFARRITLVACNVICEYDIYQYEKYEQLSFFDINTASQKYDNNENSLEKERSLQDAVLKIKHKFGKNAILKGTNFTEGATAKDRNQQIGGHKA